MKSTNFITKHSALFFFFFLFSLHHWCAFSLHASPYDMITVGDPVIEDIRFLSLETGIPFLSFTPPFAPREIENFLKKIDTAGISSAALAAYNRLEKRLYPQSPISLSWNNFSLFLNLKSTVEGKARFSKEIDYHLNKPPTFLSAAVNLYFYDKVQFYFDPEVMIDLKDYSFDGHTSNGYFLNNIWILNGNHIYGNSPFKTFIALGGDWWNFQLGRDRLSYGTGITGNLGIADNPVFYEFMRLSMFTDFFKYSLLVIQSPLDVNINKNYGGQETNNPNNHKLINFDKYPGLKDLLDKDAIMGKNTDRYFFIHRIDFTIFKRVSIGLMEGAIANNGLELRLLNPLMLFHNAMYWRDYDVWIDKNNSFEKDFDKSWQLGSFFSVEINWNIINSLSFYTQFAMNELAIGPEVKEGRVEAANGLAFMAGFQYSFAVNNWGALAYLESFYTFPFFGINRTPFSSFIFMNYNGFVHNTSYYYWFGYPRDTFSISTGVNLKNLNNNLSFDAGFSWIARGQKNEFGVVWDHDRTQESFNLKSPSGIVENRFILYLGAKWDVYSWLALQSKINGLYYINNKHIKGNNAFGGDISLSATFKY